MVQKLADKIMSLTLSEITELVSIIMKKPKPSTLAVGTVTALASTFAIKVAAAAKKEMSDKNVFELKLESPIVRVWGFDEISALTLSELADLSCFKMYQPPVKRGPAFFGFAMKVAAASANEKMKPDKIVFELKLESYDAASKMKVITGARSFTDLDLKEAKDLVEKMPCVLKKGVSKEEGEQIIEKMKALGAKVVME